MKKWSGYAAQQQLRVNKATTKDYLQNVSFLYVLKCYLYLVQIILKFKWVNSIQFIVKYEDKEARSF